jgi:hypothetical protein
LKIDFEEAGFFRPLSLSATSISLQLKENYGESPRILFLSKVAVGFLLTLMFSQMVAVEIVFHLRIFRFEAKQEKMR